MADDTLRRQGFVYSTGMVVATALVLLVPLAGLLLLLREPRGVADCDAQRRTGLSDRSGGAPTR